jgi:hypothetical protein
MAVLQRGAIHSPTPVGCDLVKLRGSALKNYWVLTKDELGRPLYRAAQSALRDAQIVTMPCVMAKCTSAALACRPSDSIIWSQ